MTLHGLDRVQIDRMTQSRGTEAYRSGVASVGEGGAIAGSAFSGASVRRGVVESGTGGGFGLARGDGVGAGTEGSITPTAYLPTSSGGP